MCLTKYKKITPEKDITCYKVVRKITENIYASPFVEARYYIGEKHKAYPIHSKSELAALLKRPDGLEDGFIHTFQNKSEARDYMRNFAAYITVPFTNPVCKPQTFAVLECKIPATAKYVVKGKYESIFSITTLSCYGSSEIKVCREIDTYFYDVFADS